MRVDDDDVDRKHEGDDDDAGFGEDSRDPGGVGRPQWVRCWVTSDPGGGGWWQAGSPRWPVSEPPLELMEEESPELKLELLFSRRYPGRGMFRL